ncbi:MAG: SDR family oxidoreductase [Deltaproteobacteria bacterium]|nr:SDR family oxidoreductase [Deltaproteobacteria bacterium]
MALALVTGAAVRVGKAIAVELARAGYDVAVHGFSSPLDDVAADIAAAGRVATQHRFDLSSIDGVFALADSVLAAHPVVDVVVHSAALFGQVAFAELTVDQWRTMQAVNVDAPVFLTQRLLPGLRRSSQACVVAIVDVMAERPSPKYLHYCASKAALSMVIKSLALELAPIRVNGVAPGVAAFPESFSPEKRAQIAATIPLGAGTAADVAGAVRFLCAAPHVTGQIVVVDGGMSIAL